MKASPSFTRADGVACAGLLPANPAVFGTGAARLGFYYYDDARPSQRLGEAYAVVEP